MIDIKLCNPLADSEWDRKMASFDAFNVFHSQAWAQTLAASYHFDPRYLVLNDADRLSVVLPMMEIRSCLTGKRGISLPFTDVCSPLFEDREALIEVFEHQLSEGRKRGWARIEMRGVAEELSAYPVEQYFLHKLELREGLDRVFTNLAPSTRRAIRKAQREAVNVISDSSWTAMKQFYYLQCITRRRHGLPPQPLSFFRNVHQYLVSTGMGKLLMATVNGVAVAGAVILICNRKAVYKFGASDMQYQSSRANNLIIWEALKRCSEIGCETFSFGRTGFSDYGLRRFKLGWGAAEEQISYCRYNLKKNRFDENMKSQNTFAKRFFQSSPLSLNRMAGRLLYRHVA